MALLAAQDLHLSYDGRDIVHGVDLALPEGKITVIVGANGSGKSTLLRGLSRLMAPRQGRVELDGQDIHRMGGKELSRRLGLLPQSPIAPDGVRVRDLVARGRFPHQGLFQQWTPQDEEAVQEALDATRTADLAEEYVGELSGGQRQRVWIAMVLAQRTEVLLLDEPTTFLDVTHQLEVLDVVRQINRTQGTTVAIVLHDLGLAARVADHMIAVRDGKIHAQGTPQEVVTEQIVREVFALESRVIPDPVTGTPLVLPLQGGEAEKPALVPTLESSPTLLFNLEVVQRRAVGKNLVRLTLASPELVHMGTGGHLLDVRIKLIIPGPQQSADHLAHLRPGAERVPEDRAGWYRTWLQIDPLDRGWIRTYSVRESRGAGHPGNVSEYPEIDIDMVLHVDPDPQPGRCVAAQWAQNAQVGDRIDVMGPNRHLAGPDYGGIEFRPGTARTVLLAGDETALPAICSILEALPSSFRGHAVIEVADETDRQRVCSRSEIQQHWLVRGDLPHGQLLDARVRELMEEMMPTQSAEAAAAQDLDDVDIDAVILWETSVGEGDFYAWLAGEAGVIKGLRRHLVSERGLDRRQVSFMGYWREGRVEM